MPGRSAALEHGDGGRMRGNEGFNGCANSITKGMLEKQGELNSKIHNNSNIFTLRE